MKLFKLFLITLLSMVVGGMQSVYAQTEVTVGTQVTSESQLVSGQAYVLKYIGNKKTAYVKDAGTYYQVTDYDETPTKTSVYYFISNGDGTWKLKNFSTGKYWSTIPGTSASSYITPVEEAPAGSWTLNFSANQAYPKNGGNYLTRSGGKLHGWASNSNSNFEIYQVALSEPLAELTDKYLSISSEAASSLSVDQWYTMFDRGANHGYLYENLSAFKLYNTNTAPSNKSAASMAKYLVRLVDAGDGKYYLQTGYGNYFSTLFDGNAGVSGKNNGTTIVAEAAYTIAKIADTDGHFFLKDPNDVLMDADNTSQGDGAINGWGTGVPEAINGNNDWAFFPIELVDDPTIVSKLDDLTGDGWYRIKMTAPNGYEGLYILNNSNENNYNTDSYPLTYQGTAFIPEDDDAWYYVRIIRNGDYVQIQSANGHYLDTYAKASNSATNLAVSYDNGFIFGNKFRPFDNGNRIWGMSSTNFKSRYALYRVTPSDNGLAAWKVTINNAGTNAENLSRVVTCTATGLSGLSAVYSGGYFFLPSGTTPTAADFSLQGLANVAIDNEAKTIIITYDPNIAIDADDVTVAQGWQTSGRDSEVMLLRVNVTPFADATGATLNVSLLDGAESNISALTLYEASSDSPEILSAGNTGAPTKTQVSTTSVSSSTATLSIGDLTAGDHYYWLGATVKSDATLGDVIDAAVTGITYTRNSNVTTLDLTSTGNPSDRGAMVFNTRSYPFLPWDNGSRVYRIPAMVVADDGSIVAAADKRYASHTDIGGGHVIDIVVRRSTDGGKTWGDPVVVAKGDNSNDATCGYGDPTLLKLANGTLVCTSCVGNLGFGGGLVRFMVSKSTDNGQSWTQPVDVVTAGTLKIKPSIGDFFITSGHGILTNDGVMMYLVVSKLNGTNTNFVIYSTDEGEHWTIDDTVVYSGGDEAKLAQLDDGSLIASVRQGLGRGFNFGSYTKNVDGTVSFTWGAQYQNSQLHNGGSANNQDIFYYQREAETGKTDVIFHSMTTGQHANLKLYYSTDQGQNWTEFLNVQTKGTRYVTMDKSSAGSLYLLFEDQSLNAAGGYTDYNHYPINFLEITREQLEELIPTLNDFIIPGYMETAEVKVVYGKTAHTTYGTLSNLTWTSNSTAGMAGLTMMASDGEFNYFSNWNNHYNIAYHPAKAQTDATLTLTAPSGYVIKSYSMLVARGSSATHTYTVTTAAGISVDVPFGSNASSYATVSQDDINDASTVISVQTSDAGKWLAIADFTVTLAKTSPLNVVGDASYATLYLPFDVTTTGATKAYYIATVDNGSARLTATGNDGTEIPGRTAVVLINSEAATTTAFTRTSGLSSVVSEDANLLKGTFVEKSLDLGDATPYYSMGKIDDEIGFYKFNNNGTTTITLGANKAYLDTTTPTGNVKGFTLSFGGEDGINQMVNGKSVNGTWYDLNGRRLSGAPAAKGVYIVGGKKVVVK